MDGKTSGVGDLPVIGEPFVYAYHMITRRILLPPLLVIAAGLFPLSSEAQLQHFPKSQLTIVSATGPHHFTI
jgi:hypothetical protein